jgi:preprotein translocase subunit YajC
LDFLFAFSAPEGQGGGGFAAFLPFILIMAVIYFLMIRPQSKRQKEKRQMLDNIKKGDRVITIGGIHGSVAGIKNNGKVVVLKVDKNMNITVNKTAVAGLAGNVTEEDTQIKA